jgi:prephenate dehydrogenase
MAMGILKSNRENILNTLQTFRGALDQIESVLQSEDYPQLELLLDQSRAAYQALITDH